MQLSRLDDKGVKFIEELMIAGQGRFKGGAKVLISGFGMGEAVAFEDTSRVSVNHEDRVPPCVKKDGVGGFGADTAKSEKLCAEGLRWRGEQSIEGAAVYGEEEGDKSFEGPSFLPEIAGRAEARGKPP